MVRIGICDDEKQEREQAEKLCRLFFQAKEEEVRIICFSSGEEIIRYPEFLDILILDIEMSDMSGIQVKNRLEYGNCNTKILFLSSHEEKMPEAFGLNVCAFLKKPVQRQSFFNHMEKLWNRMERSPRYEVDTEIGRLKIPVNDILYVTVDKHYCEIVCMERKIKIRKKIQQVEEELNNPLFFRCHRSYLVNLYQIDRLREDAVMMNGDIVLVSRTNRKAMREKYGAFVQRQVEQEWNM